jgi:hypothetical protein
VGDVGGRFDRSAGPSGAEQAAALVREEMAAILARHGDS